MAIGAGLPSAEAVGGGCGGSGGRKLPPCSSAGAGAPGTDLSSWLREPDDDIQQERAAPSALAGPDGLSRETSSDK